jgi:signal transduction histidine kinase
MSAATSAIPLNVLLVEDSEEDADLVVLELKRGGFTPKWKRVDTAESLRDALDEGDWDIIVSDYSLPRFSMAAALDMVQEKGVDVPFVIVSATIGEEAAVAAMKAGAHDYILKDKLARLVPAVQRELKESEMRRERRNLEEQLRQAQKLESLGLLAGGVAHDFNNLLTGILGNASLALEVLDPPEPARTMLDDVIRASERAADLTRQLLAYAGKGKFIIQRLDLTEIVRDIVDLIRTSIPRRVDLRLELDPHLPAIEGDPSQIQQLVMNLVINAGEAMGEGSGVVVVRSGTRDLEGDYFRCPGEPLKPGRYVHLEVEDTGCGMDSHTVEHIFDPFFTTKFTGRGLGLAAVQGIVRAHKGAIRVFSAPGAGSTFMILLPAAEARPAAAAALPHVDAVSLRGSGTILIVDDEVLVRRTARSTLERFGYHVIEASNGREAVQAVGHPAMPIDLVVLDLMMPIMGGEEAYAAIKASRPELPVILSSGYDEAEATRRFSGQGIAAFIQKPYTSSRLAEKVKEVLVPSMVERRAQSGRIA